MLKISEKFKKSLNINKNLINEIVKLLEINKKTH